MQRQPTLHSSCASAATAAELRYRIDGPEPAPRASRIIALDEGAAAIVRGLAGQHRGGAHFLMYGSALPGNGAGGHADVALHTLDGGEVLLSEEILDADVVVMIATEQARAEAASVIGDTCARRMVMPVGLVVAPPGRSGEVVPALRPNAMVLAVLEDGSDISGILSALRV